MGENSIDVSVIIPVYNTEPYLRDCLDSVLAQDYGSIEVIMVNDGSTDGSRAIMEEYSRADSRFVCIDQENQGAGGARNAGIRAARGRYILFVDADDELLDGALRELMPLAFEHNLDMVRLGWRRTKTPETESSDAGIERDTVLEREKFIEYFSENTHEFSYMCALYRSELIKANDISFKTRFCEDILFNMTALFCCGSVYITSKDYYFYRPHERELTVRFFEEYDLNKERNKAMIEMLTLPVAFESDILTHEQKNLLRKKIKVRAAGSYLGLAGAIFAEMVKENRIHPDIKIAFWGAGKYSKHYINMLNGLHLKNAVFVDNDPSKCGGDNYGYPVVAPSEILKPEYEGYKHFITSLYVFEFFTQMKELGIVKSFADMRLDVGENKQYDLQLRAADELFCMIYESEREEV